MTTNISIETLTASHIPAALSFCRDAGWNQLDQDWRRLVSYEPHGCFGAFQEERLVGTVTTTTYGSELAWIGMMLVDPGLRRHGIATALMQRAISYLRGRSVECIKLDATPEGEFVYSQLGFKEEWTFHRWKREARTISLRESNSSTASATSRVSRRNLELDLQAFGADRSDYLIRLIGDSSPVFMEGGFGMVREGYLASYLGPVCATTPTVARTSIQELLGSTVGPVFWDIPGQNIAAEEIAKEFDFVPVRTLKRMRLGTYSKSADLSAQFALADPATG